MIYSGGKIELIALCKVCNSSIFKEIFLFNGCYFSDGTKGLDDLHKEECQCCGTVRTKLQIDLNDFYLNNYQPSRNIDTVAFTNNEEINRSKFIYDWMKDLITKNILKKFNSVLEIGCGQGFLLEKFNIKNKYGIEPSKKASTKASKIANVRNIFYEEINNTEKYDFVTSYCVIEHVEDPKTFLEKNYRILNDDGTMCIALPIQDKFNYDLVFADHIHHFNHENFVKLLYNNGFRVINYELGKGSYFNIVMYVCKKMRTFKPKDFSYIYNQNIDNVKIIFDNIHILSKKQSKNKLYAFGYGEITKTILSYTEVDNYIVKYIDDYTSGDKIITSKLSKKIFKNEKTVDVLLLVNPSHIKNIINIYKDVKNINFINIFDNITMEL